MCGLLRSNCFVISMIMQQPLVVYIGSILETNSMPISNYLSLTGKSGLTPIFIYSDFCHILESKFDCCIEIVFLTQKQLFLYISLYNVFKKALRQKQMISISKRCAEHPFAGRNTQHSM